VFYALKQVSCDLLYALFCLVCDYVNWKNHFGHIIPKLIGACYAVRSMYHISKIGEL
jgi:hypothetical protein